MVPEAKLYKEFGINAELIIDHAWGREPCTIADIHAYRPIKHSISHSQILLRNYTYEEAYVPMRENGGVLGTRAFTNQRGYEPYSRSYRLCR